MMVHVSRMLLVALMSALALSACTTRKVSDDDLKPVDVRTVREMLADTRRPAVLVDVRPKERFDGGHLPGAIHIPLPQIQANDARLAQARNIIVYSAGHRDYLSSAAAKKLLALGYVNVFDFRGGVEAWREAGGRFEVD